MNVWRRGALVPGIYDEVVTERLADALAALAPALRAHEGAFAEREDVVVPVGAMLRDALELALDEVRGKPDKTRALAEHLLDVLRTHAVATFPAPEAPSRDELRLLPRRLRAITPAAEAPAEAPRGSLHTSSLLVNAPGAQLLDHLRSEFATADRVDLLCSFVKLSGFDRLRTALELHTETRGRPLRVLTTTYMQASDVKAIQRFASLRNTEIKVSFDELDTRLHAKAWIFHRDSGYTTAYVGSSNLSHAAQTEGLEWNVRITSSDQPALVEQMAETFNQYWSDGHQFEPIDPANPRTLARLRAALEDRAVAYTGPMVEIEPKDFQKDVLSELVEARRLGRHRNLLVAATGTGKTVMAALDYRALREAGKVDTLLFVAHRREILQQAQAIFRATLQSRTFGELLYDGQTPRHPGRHLFASIDSLGPDHPFDAYDMVILDEAHHSGARSWNDLLERLRPKELLGLTGTPERADGLDYTRHFPRPWVGNLRVWNAIPHALVPFRYYQVSVTGVDLRDVAWVAGRYAPEALAGKLVGSAEVFVARAVEAIEKHIARRDRMRALAFCVNIRHAQEVDAQLRARGFTSRVLTGETPAEERANAKLDLDAGSVQILCVVDLYNEGVDVPNVNTLFFFRPTESATVFLQQLGRGLRRARDKSELVVFDLTGRQSHQFRFDRRLRALTGNTPRQLRELVTTGFGRLPAGCHLDFDPISRDEVLAQIKRAIPDDTRGIRTLLLEPAQRDLSLAEFLHHTDVALDDLYRVKSSWTLLRRSVGLDIRPLADGEEKALAALPKLVHVGDATRLGVWERLVALQAPTTELERRVTRMLFGVLYERALATDDAGAWARWISHPVLREEIAALIPVLAAENAVLAEAHRLHPDVPLVLHGRYLGVEISAAFDDRSSEGQLRDYYTGVERTFEDRYDLLLVTMEKSEATKEHLRYRDFPLNEHRFHWQSKSRTRRDSRDGRRLLTPALEGNTALLFVRERADDRPGVTMAFTYLGPVRPDGDAGERPITVEWRLDHAMPRGLLAAGRVAS